MRLSKTFAESKGRSRLAWWFESLFFGPICTFLIVFPTGDEVQGPILTKHPGKWRFLTDL